MPELPGGEAEPNRDTTTPAAPEPAGREAGRSVAGSGTPPGPADALSGPDAESRRGPTEQGTPPRQAAEREAVRAAAIAEEQRRPRRRGLLTVLAVVGAVALAFAFGALNPERPSGISTDRLGPETGEPVADYLDGARESLRGTDTDPRWALVSFTTEVRPEQIPVVGAGTRIGQALYRVPIPDVATPLVAVPLPEGDAVAVASADAAAGQLTGQLEHTVDQRYRRVLTVSAARLRAHCACLVGLVVRADLPRLNALAALPGVRAVQALPADAVSGGFAINPLLPAQTDRALPGPDTGPVPDS